MMTVGTLLASAFHQARGSYSELNKQWIAISWKIGSRLPASLLSVGFQRDGELDLVIRCMEDETAKLIVAGSDDPLFTTNYLSVMSTYWIGGMYETFRLLKERRLSENDDRFVAIFRNLELLRIPLEKHEIAKDRALTEPIVLVGQPANKDNRDSYVYAKDDPARSHIMPSGISGRGSMMWQATDLKNLTSTWIERRLISDQVLDLWRDDV